MFSFFKKKIVVPESNETKTVETVQLWYVRWTRRYGTFNGETETAMEAFTSEKDANDFALSLVRAYKLLQHTSGTDVHIHKN